MVFQYGAMVWCRVSVATTLGHYVPSYYGMESIMSMSFGLQEDDYARVSRPVPLGCNVCRELVQTLKAKATSSKCETHLASLKLYT